MKDPLHIASFKALYFSRLREFYRQPARIFWVYGFPMILAVVLGLAFQSKPQTSIEVDLVQNAAAESIQADLKAFAPKAAKLGLPSIELFVNPAEIAIEKRLKTGKTPLVVEGTSSESVIYHFDQTRADAAAARSLFDDVLQRARGRADTVPTRNELITEPGSRYVDFLIPGLIALNTMGGGLWGVGFLLVNFRIAKLLKRFNATPMPRPNFLLAILASRMTFLLPDVGVLLALGVFGFGMPIKGDFLALIVVELAGALAFAGIGLLVASRASTTETVSGLMNLVMVPMWLLSGVFFRSELFARQIFVKALPLTLLVDGLRAVILDGAGFGQVWPSIAGLTIWSVGTFWLALKLFRWN